MAYRYLPHTADVRVAFEADSLAALCADAVGVVRELVAGASPVEHREERAVTLQATDVEQLFFGLLRELVYTFATDGFVPADLALERLTPTALHGRLRGEPFDPARHEQQPEVKAVTRHGLKVREQDGVWLAEVIFDL